jgi:pimeloyl-ACP methyl ester carboxylesterase
MNAEAPTPAPPRSRLRRWLVAIPGIYAAFSLLVAGYFLGANAVRWSRRPVYSTPKDLAVRAQEVSFRAADGYALAGVLADPVDRAPILIVQHGKRRNRDDVLPWARAFARAGYGVLSFDWRGHGRSDGSLILHGAQESKDVAAALAMLASRPETKDRPVGIVAFSMGAASVAMSGPVLDDRVKAVVLDSPYGDLGRMVRDRLDPLGPFGLGPRLAIKASALPLFGMAPSEIRPEWRLKAFAPRPVFVTHGAHDTIVPTSEGRALRDAYPGPVTYWETQERGHCSSRVLITQEWMRRVAGFLAEHLEGAPSAERVLEGVPEHIESGWATYRDRAEEGATP